MKRNRHKLSRTEKILISILIWVFICTSILWFKKDNSDVKYFADIFNGYLSPLISLLAAFLVYTSFREQIKANKIIQTQWSFEIYLRIFNEVKASIEEITVKVYDMNILTEHKGLEAFRHITYNNSSSTYYTFKNLQPIMKEFLRLVNKLSVESLGDDYLEYKIFLYYESNIRPIADLVRMYFDKNPHRVRTKQVNLVLFEIFKQLEDKMQKLQEKYDDEFFFENTTEQ